MRLPRSRGWALVYECFGGALVIALCWVREMTGVVKLLFGAEPRTGDWRMAALGTCLILLVWGGMFFLTYRLVKHLVYLEKFIRICSWCRKVCYRGTWMPLEDYFARGFHVGTTHGICPECLQQAKADTTRFFRRKGAKVETRVEDSEPSGH